jgi:hypothetical protein
MVVLVCEEHEVRRGKQWLDLRFWEEPVVEEDLYLRALVQRRNSSAELVRPAAAHRSGKNKGEPPLAGCGERPERVKNMGDSLAIIETAENDKPPASWLDGLLTRPFLDSATRNPEGLRKKDRFRVLRPTRDVTGSEGIEGEE